MKTNQKGASSALIILIIVILAIIVGAYYWRKNSSTNISPTATTTGVNGYTAAPTGGNTDQTVLTPLNTNSPNSGNATVNTSAPGGTTYQFPTGLTLAFPATWKTYSVIHTAPSFGGVTPTDSTTFSVGGQSALTINTFTKEQWNRIRTQENAANQNVNSLGEGQYLGENSTYIYSYIINGRQAEAQQILNTVVRY